MICHRHFFFFCNCFKVFVWLVFVVYESQMREAQKEINMPIAGSSDITPPMPQPVSHLK